MKKKTKKKQKKKKTAFASHATTLPRRVSREYDLELDIHDFPSMHAEA